MQAVLMGSGPASSGALADPAVIGSLNAGLALATRAGYACRVAPWPGIFRRWRVPRNAGSTATAARAACAPPPAGTRHDSKAAGIRPSKAVPSPNLTGLLK